MLLYENNCVMLGSIIVSPGKNKQKTRNANFQSWETEPNYLGRVGHSMLKLQSHMQKLCSTTAVKQVLQNHLEGNLI